ncbi:GDSL-type esterase/lipase family protein [Albimonas pacifica]|uniref:Lysophospholipase L1 n=1 Tax=Albimonas pacifica TaxID=1114924 RepID=A0A1I3IKD3_9RHOB|nr:GDSL-type esterase/lipase family protein [Albimonas pacifica]SFI48458.1 Lysophospholipase L1 [Albimonas pacifica]
MATLPPITYYWRPAGAADDAWLADPDGSFAPGVGAAVEVVSVGPSRPAFITADSAPSLVEPLADLGVAPGAPMSVDLAAAFSGTNLAFSVVSGPAGASVSGGTLSWTPAGEQTVEIVVRAANAAGWAQDAFTVNVSAAAAIPVAMTPMEAVHGATLVASAAGYLPAGAFSYTLVSAPAEATGVSLDAATGRLSAMMPASGALSAPFVIRATGETIHDLSLSVDLVAGWSYGAAVAVGDSITAGGSGGVTSWVDDVLVAQWGATADNNGAGGSVLQGSLADGGAPLPSNLMSVFVSRSLPAGAEAIVCAYGFNDARYTLAEATFNAQAYARDLRSALRRWLVRYGRENIWLATPFWISDTGLVTAYDPAFAGRTRAWFEGYVEACRTVAAEFGVKLVDAYEIGYPATTVDDIHPTAAAQAALVAAFGAPKRPALAVSTAAPVGGDETITVPPGGAAYLVAADGTTETALVEGANAMPAGSHLVVWSDGGRWEVGAIAVTSSDPTAGMTQTTTWTAGAAFSNLRPTQTALTVRFTATRAAGDHGVLWEAGGSAYGACCVIHDDGGVDRLTLVMGYSNGSHVSAADLAVISTPAPTGTFEVVISGDCLGGQKAALYIDGTLAGVDSVAAAYLTGNRNGGLAQVWDEIPSNPAGWSAEGDGLNTMVSEAAIFAGQATAAVTS